MPHVSLAPPPFSTLHPATLPRFDGTLRTHGRALRYAGQSCDLRAPIVCRTFSSSNRAVLEPIQHHGQSCEIQAERVGDMVSKEPNHLPSANSANGNAERAVRFKDLEDGGRLGVDGGRRWSGAEQGSPHPNRKSSGGGPPREAANGGSVVGAVRGDMEGTIGAVAAILARTPPHPAHPGPHEADMGPDSPLFPNPAQPPPTLHEHGDPDLPQPAEAPPSLRHSNPQPELWRLRERGRGSEPGRRSGGNSGQGLPPEQPYTTTPPLGLRTAPSPAAASPNSLHSAAFWTGISAPG
ncbi:hypothetical protein SKAU_G00354790 [Synaphobranchus kaupii]|uniref:Uncharacterized protein n=1 Tax=Synaphobranchus kaupii TaxID=118154 RepID=A0A9Q1EH28_SYNKA|nr:hypothetical protein SKAU_G00354790 [Synaphobranchus kaupii]